MTTSLKKNFEILEYQTGPWNPWKVLEFQWQFWKTLEKSLNLEYSMIYRVLCMIYRVPCPKSAPLWGIPVCGVLLLSNFFSGMWLHSWWFPFWEAHHNTWPLKCGVSVEFWHPWKSWKDPWNILELSLNFVVGILWSPWGPFSQSFKRRSVNKIVFHFSVKNNHLICDISISSNSTWFYGIVLPHTPLS